MHCSSTVLNMKRNFVLICIPAALLLFSCQKETKKLPVLGEKVIKDGDTIYHRIPDFTFVDQDSQQINNASFAGKAYVVDFFFISCPTICPKVKKQMLRIYERFEKDERLLLLSHSIDTKHDTVARLKEYSANLGVSASKWKFVTGDKMEIYSIADDYFSIVKDDPDAPGGFDHSGRLILIDENRHIRSFCDGTDPTSVDKFMEDIDALLAEMEQKKL